MSSPAVSVRPISRAEAAELAEQCTRVLIEQFGARRVLPFGSVTGESPWHSRSDIDLAVEGLKPELFFKAWAALDRLLPPGLELDLIDLRDAPPELRAHILGEVRMPKDNVAALKLEIEAELKNLERAVTKVAEYLPKTGDEDEAQQIAIAKFLHDFYVGVERIFERITVRLEGGLPSGEDWHRRLLNRMAEPLPGVRPAVIDAPLRDRLDEFLRFRHLIRHTYAYELEWPRMKPLAEELVGELMPRVRAALDAFVSALGSESDPGT